MNPIITLYAEKRDQTTPRKTSPLAKMAETISDLFVKTVLNNKK